MNPDSTTHRNDPGYGALFVNHRKRPESRQPDYTGTATCCSCEQPLKLGGWKKESRNGQAYLSLKLQPPQNTSTSQARPSDDDLPF